MKEILELIGDGKDIDTRDYTIRNGGKTMSVSIKSVENAKNPLVKEIVKNFDPKKYVPKIAFAYQSKTDFEYSIENMYLPRVIILSIFYPYNNMFGKKLNMPFLPVIKYGGVVFDCEPLLKPDINDSVTFENCLWSEPCI